MSISGIVAGSLSGLLVAGDAAWPYAWVLYAPIGALILCPEDAKVRESSTAKVDLVRSIGADQVIDYTKDDYLDGAKRYDLILDIGGNSRLSRLRGALTPKGSLVIVGGEEGGNFTGGSVARFAAACSRCS